MSGLVAGVDLGGTNCTAAVVDDDHQVVDRVRAKTPQGGPDDVLAAIARVVRQLDAEPVSVGVGVPGPVNAGVVMVAPNLPGWSAPVPVADRLTEELGLPVAVGNDVNVAAFGEWVAGAGRGSSFMLGVWLGTGVGGGLILDGRPYEGAFGGAGEFGHMTVRPGGALCGCGRRGCVEAYAGRASMEHTVDVAVAAGQSTALLDIRDSKGKQRLTAGVWAKALEKRDDLAAKVVAEAVDAVGIAVAASVNLLDLDRVVIGGGLTEKLGQPLADRIAAAAEPWILVQEPARQVVVAELEDDAGAIGAASLARRLLSR